MPSINELKLAKELIAFPSITPKDAGAINFLSRKLKSLGFITDNLSGNYRLTIQTEYTDPKSGYTKISSVRTEISGLANIQEYCKTNSLDMSPMSNIARNIQFVQKNRKIYAHTAVVEL